MTERDAMTAVVAAWISRGVLLALVASAAWFYGGVEQGFRSFAAAVLAAAGAVTVCVGFWSRRPEAPGVMIASVGPLGLAILAASQLIGGGVPVGAIEDWRTPHTLYPAETRLALGGFLTAAAAALLGAALFAERNAFRALLAALVVIGAATSVVGMGTLLTGEDRFIRGERVAGTPFSTFVNRNNAAGFLQVCLAAGLGLTATCIDSNGSQTGRSDAIGRLADSRMTLLLVALAGSGTCLAGIIASRSRSGTAAALLTVAFAVLSQFSRNSVRRSIVGVPIAAVGAGLLLWLGLAGPTIDRFKALDRSGLFEDVRFAHWVDASDAFLARPLWGAGAGAYSVAYGEFAELPDTAVFEHADGQYVELAVENGAAGILVFLIAACALVGGVARHSLGRRPEVTALGALLVGQSAHAMFDFSAIIPAVTLSAGLLAGAAIGGARTGETEDEVRPFESPPRFGVGQIRRPLGLVILAVVSAGLIWASLEHAGASVVDRAGGAAARLLRQSDVSPESLDPLIRFLSDALRDRPDDAEGHRVLGDLWVQRYRLAVADRIVELDRSLKPNQVRRSTTLVSLHRTVNLLSRSGAVAGLRDLREDPLVAQNLVPARRHYEAAAAACPRLRRIWLPLACLSFVDGGSPAGLREITIEGRLHPADPASMRLAARLAWQAGDAEIAGRSWQRAFELDSGAYGRVLSEIAPEVGPAKAVDLTLPRDADAALRVVTLAGDLADEFRPPLGAAFAAFAAGEAPAASRARCAAVSAWFLGDLRKARAGFDDAVRRFPTEPRVRADYARFLLERGRAAEAADSLRIAEAIDPGDAEVRYARTLSDRNTAADPGRGGAAGR